MNDKQRYNTLNKKHRKEIMILMAQVIHERQHPPTLLGLPLIERRARSVAHYLHERRQRRVPLTWQTLRSLKAFSKKDIQRITRQVMFVFIVFTLTNGVITVATNIPRNYGVPLVMLTQLGISSVLAWKPRRLRLAI